MEEFKTSLAVMQVHDILTMADNLDFSGFKSSTITVMLFFFFRKSCHAGSGEPWKQKKGKITGFIYWKVLRW